MVDILSAINMIMDPINFVGLFFGVLVGIAFGCMPGLSVNMGLALLFPLAFSFHGIGGILMLLLRCYLWRQYFCYSAETSWYTCIRCNNS